MRPDPLSRLRAYRVRPRPDPSIGPVIDHLRRDLARSRGVEGRLAEAWAELAPQDVRARAHPESLKAGVLTVRVTDSAILYSADRWLRAGGRAALAARTGIGLKRVRLVV